MRSDRCPSNVIFSIPNSVYFMGDHLPSVHLDRTQTNRANAILPSDAQFCQAPIFDCDRIPSNRFPVSDS
jgi:hypothetical protein